MSSGNFAAQRGPSPGARFTFYAIAAIALMFFDQRGGWLERARYGLAAAAYPLNLAINSPSAALRWVQEALQSRNELQLENTQLLAQQRELRIRQLRLAQLERENAELRGLRNAVPPLIEKWLSGEVIQTESTSQRQRLLVNRGAVNGVFKSQAVLAADGLVGQTLRVGPWSSEIILITDPEHAVPVQVQRNGLRTIAVGVGDTSTLSLPYLPIQSDVRDGDLLATSGLGGVFPAGYPVAKIIEVKRDGASVLAQVKAEPLARFDRDREVMFVWFSASSPAAPVGEAGGSGAAALKPLATPPPRAPAPVTVSPALTTALTPALTPALPAAAGPVAATGKPRQ
jgi:rod shape-determining protein MreC